MEIFLNTWVVGIGTGVTVGLILYYIFGIGRNLSNENETSGNRKGSEAQHNSRQREYEIELKSFRNDMARRGLAHSSIRLKGEADLKKKFGIESPGNLNEIEINVNGVIYRLTDQNNNNKYTRAKNDAGQNASSEQILAHYDKLAGLIQNRDGNEIENGSFWDKEKKKLGATENRVQNFWRLWKKPELIISASLLFVAIVSIPWWPNLLSFFTPGVIKEESQKNLGSSIISATSTIDIVDVINQYDKLETSLEKDAFLEKYKQTEVRGLGTYFDIAKSGNGFRVGIKIFEKIVVCQFTPELEKKLLLLRIGQKLSFLGIFEYLEYPERFFVRDCKLLE